MVKSYMKIVDTSVYDMVPKYIILGLVQEVTNICAKKTVNALV